MYIPVFTIYSMRISFILIILNMSWLTHLSVMMNYSCLIYYGTVILDLNIRKCLLAIITKQILKKVYFNTSHNTHAHNAYEHTVYDIKWRSHF